MVHLRALVHVVPVVKGMEAKGSIQAPHLPPWSPRRLPFKVSRSDRGGWGGVSRGGFGVPPDSFGF